MLLNEFLKAHQKLEQQQKQIEALTAGLQKVTARVELKQTAPRVVSDNVPESHTRPCGICSPGDNNGSKG
jgi:hypothetical protein